MTSSAENKHKLSAVSVAEDIPTITIRPSRGWVALNLRDLWLYRELLCFLTWRDIKVRYKQTVLGAALAVLQPFFTMVVFSVFFGRLAKVPSDGISYPIFAYCALVPWSYFAGALDRAGNSLVGSANLITKVYFPRLAIPVSAALESLACGTPEVGFAVGGILHMVSSGITGLLAPPEDVSALRADMSLSRSMRRRYRLDATWNSTKRMLCSNQRQMGSVNH